MKSKGGKRVSAGLSGGGARQQKKQRLGDNGRNGSGMIYSTKHVRIQAAKRSASKAKGK